MEEAPVSLLGLKVTFTNLLKGCLKVVDSIKKKTKVSHVTFKNEVRVGHSSPELLLYLILGIKLTSIHQNLIISKIHIFLKRHYTLQHVKERMPLACLLLLMKNDEEKET